MIEGALADFAICPRADLPAHILETLHASATIFQCSQCGCEIRVVPLGTGKIPLCANCYNNKSWEDVRIATMNSAEPAYGNPIIYQGKRGTLVSVDSPKCVVLMDGAGACEVVPLDSVQKAFMDSHGNILNYEDPKAQKIPKIYACGYAWCQGHTSQSDTCESRAAKRPSDFSLEDLLAKISGFRERLQEDDLPMLSKASVLAQIVTAQQLTRIADALERMVR
jgi:hypothetical protein